MNKRFLIEYYEAEGKNLKSHHIDRDYRGMFRQFSSHATRRALVEKWLESTKPTETFLDVGCELGYFVRKMAQKGLLATGVDISPTKIRKAKFIALKLKIHTCQFSVMDAESLEFKDNSFDWVLCSETLEHIFNDKTAINELIRVARHHLIITVPQKSLYWRVLHRIQPIYGFTKFGAGHLREYTLPSLLPLFQNRVQIESVKTCSFLTTFLDRFLSTLPWLKTILCLKLKKGK